MTFIGIKRIFFVLIVSFVSLSVSFGQPTGGGPGGGQDPDVPIGGLEILLIAGGALGIGKHIFKRRKK